MDYPLPHISAPLQNHFRAFLSRHSLQVLKYSRGRLKQKSAQNNGHSKRRALEIINHRNAKNREKGDTQRFNYEGSKDTKERKGEGALV